MKSVQELLNKAKQATLDGHLQSALEYCLDILKIQHQQPETLKLKAQICNKLGNLDLAETYYLQSIECQSTASALHALALPELITSTAQEYESLALELAFNLDKLISIKKNKFQTNKLRTSLFDAQMNTNNIENCILKFFE